MYCQLCTQWFSFRKPDNGFHSLWQRDLPLSGITLISETVRIATVSKWRILKLNDTYTYVLCIDNTHFVFFQNRKLCFKNVTKSVLKLLIKLPRIGACRINVTNVRMYLVLYTLITLFNFKIQLRTSDSCVWHSNY